MKIRNVNSLLPLGISFLLSLVAYSTVLQSFFLSDDFDLIGRVLTGNFSLTWGLGHGGFWLLLCGLMISLLLGFGKRRAELYAVSGASANRRKVLEHYEPIFLDKIIVVTATCVILTYSLYTMSKKRSRHTEQTL
jgi:hypothetical protein